MYLHVEPWFDPGDKESTDPNFLFFQGEGAHFLTITMKDLRYHLLAGIRPDKTYGGKVGKRLWRLWWIGSNFWYGWVSILRQRMRSYATDLGCCSCLWQWAYLEDLWTKADGIYWYMISLQPWKGCNFCCSVAIYIYISRSRSSSIITNGPIINRWLIFVSSYVY